MKPSWHYTQVVLESHSSQYRGNCEARQVSLLRRKPLGQLVQEEVLVSVQVMQGNSQTEQIPLVRKELEASQAEGRVGSIAGFTI